YAPDVTETTCVAILQPGYRIGERTIRPARVAVAEPQPGAQTVKAEDGSEAGDDKDNGPEEG
ncbi:MAG: nucleotide exchange factor GrpE, partial [Streptomyces sp.]